MSTHSTPNRLIRQKSPYLLQHAYNPVDWYPWGAEAFDKSRRENKPIFLSIGYSSCYWCHVMEREVFENPDIARLMNEKLVCIKVDREEQPDIDRIYMTALQVMTGGGGWPMSVFLTPGLKPFYAGTYFPPRSIHGRPGFPEVVTRISEAWNAQRERLLEIGDQITEHLRREASGDAPAAADESVIDEGFRRYARVYDSGAGGFGGAPKFPRPSVFGFLFRYYWRSGDREALRMSLETLSAMARGGIYDHIGGGFHRYSVDALWRIPHFEKMLYDQAQLVCSYLEAFQITGDETFAAVARQTLGYVARRMQTPDGAFAAAEDAESLVRDEKHEGAFYLWTAGEIRDTLGREEAPSFMHQYGVEEQGNATHDPMGAFQGQNILYQASSLEETAHRFGKTPPQVRLLLEGARAKLFQRRELRPKPFRDDKAIAAWNGMMISSFALASRILQDASYLSTARRAAGAVLSSLYKPEERTLFRRHLDGDARFPGTLQDYAALALGLQDLYEASGEISWLQTALELAALMVEQFWDKTGGVFFDNRGDDPSQLLRTREFYDGAEPTGNSLAAVALLRLARITENKTWQNMAEDTIRSFGVRLSEMPDAAPHMLVALDQSLAAPREIVIAYPEGTLNLGLNLLHEVYRHFLPHRTLLHADGGRGQEILSTCLPFVRGMKPAGSSAAVYICENYACQLPVTDPAQIGERLWREAPPG